MREKLLTIREAAHYLGISEKEVIEFAEQGLIPAYKIGGAYLRFKKEQLDSVKNNFNNLIQKDNLRYSFFDRVKDFFYYNDFYIICLLIIAILIYYIFHS